MRSGYDCHFTHCGGRGAWRDPFREPEAIHPGTIKEEKHRSRSFRVDIRDMGGEYRMEAELPGFSSQEITLEISGDCMTIAAEHCGTGEEGGLIRCERFAGPFARSFDLTGIRSERITACCQYGLLLVTLPKKSGCDLPVRRLRLEER